MNFIISEDRIHNLVMKHLNSMFDVDNINFTYGTDDEGNEVGYTALFYQGDFSDDEDLFRWYSKDYWNNDSSHYSFNLVEKWKNASPILDFVNREQKEQLDSLFGDKWYQPFKDWFMENFGLPIKTIE